MLTGQGVVGGGGLAVTSTVKPRSGGQDVKGGRGAEGEREDLGKKYLKTKLSFAQYTIISQ